MKSRVLKSLEKAEALIAAIDQGEPPKICNVDFGPMGAWIDFSEFNFENISPRKWWGMNYPDRPYPESWAAEDRQKEIDDAAGLSTEERIKRWVAEQHQRIEASTRRASPRRGAKRR